MILYLDNALDYLVHSDGLKHIMKIIFNTTMSNSLKVECLHVLCVTCENNGRMSFIIPSLPFLFLFFTVHIFINLYNSNWK